MVKFKLKNRRRDAVACGACSIEGAARPALLLRRQPTTSAGT